MKGSPILATALACLIMLGMYVGMRVAFSKPTEPTDKLKIVEQPTTAESSMYVEIYFSSQPKSFSLTHPATGKALIKVEQLDAPEWSGTLSIPVKTITSEDLEIQGNAEWDSSGKSEGYQFMQVIISPDDLDSQSRTLRAESNISDIMTFHWKEQE